MGIVKSFITFVNYFRKKVFKHWPQVIYNNQPIEVLMKAAADSVKAGEPVWFGSEVNLSTVSMAAGLNKLDRLSVASFSSQV
jgi:aminopeptidase C